MILEDKKSRLALLEASMWHGSIDGMNVKWACSCCKEEHERHFSGCELHVQVMKLRAEIRKEESDKRERLLHFGLEGWEPHKDLWRRHIEEFHDGARAPIWEFVTPDADDLTAEVFFYTDVARESAGGDVVFVFREDAAGDMYRRITTTMPFDMISGEVQRVSIPLAPNTRYRGPIRDDKMDFYDTFPGKTYIVALEIRGVRRGA